MMATSNVKPLPLPSRNPLPLSAAQEAQVRDMYYKNVRGHCANEIRGDISSSSLLLCAMLTETIALDFASCALNRTISATWACRTERLAMNSCMVSHATQAEQDAAREEWFATRDVRIRQREEKEKKKKEQEKFHREWWGMPPLPEDNQEGKARDTKR